MAADDAFLELEPVVGRLLERHLATTKEWFPHELVPWSRGRDFVAGERGVGSDPTSRPRPTRCAARSSSTSSPRTTCRTTSATIERDVRPRRRLGRVGPAVDGRGGPPLDRHPRLPDRHPRRRPGRARARPGWHRSASGEVPEPPTVADGLVYVALQELATRIAHRNTGKLLDDPAGYEVMARVAADENLHHLFYRDLVSAAIELDPSAMVHRHRAPGARASRCPAPASRLRRARARPSPRPASTTSRPPRADPRAGRDAPMEGRGAHRLECGGSKRPAIGSCATSSGAARWPPASRAATRASGPASRARRPREELSLPRPDAAAARVAFARVRRWRRWPGAGVEPEVVGCHQAGPADRDTTGTETCRTHPLRLRSPSQGCRPCALPRRPR